MVPVMPAIPRARPAAAALRSSGPGEGCREAALARATPVDSERRQRRRLGWRDRQCRIRRVEDIVDADGVAALSGHEVGHLEAAGFAEPDLMRLPVFAELDRDPLDAEQFADEGSQ